MALMDREFCNTYSHVLLFVKAELSILAHLKSRMSLFSFFNLQILHFVFCVYVIALKKITYIFSKLNKNPLPILIKLTKNLLSSWKLKEFLKTPYFKHTCGNINLFYQYKLWHYYCSFKIKVELYL